MHGVAIPELRTQQVADVDRVQPQQLEREREIERTGAIVPRRIAARRTDAPTMQRRSDAQITAPGTGFPGACFPTGTAQSADSAIGARESSGTTRRSSSRFRRAKAAARSQGRSPWPCSTPPGAASRRRAGQRARSGCLPAGSARPSERRPQSRCSRCRRHHPRAAACDRTSRTRSSSSRKSARSAGCRDRCLRIRGVT
jgi:hypothetical protein